MPIPYYFLYKFKHNLFMVHADELSDEDDFICPSCGSSLSLLRRTVEETGALAILVTCEGCEDYYGFVVDLQMNVEGLETFSEYSEETYTALLQGYEWDDDLDDEL